MNIHKAIKVRNCIIFIVLIGLIGIEIGYSQAQTDSRSNEIDIIEHTIRACIGWAKNKDLALLYRVIANDSSYCEIDPDGSVIKGFEQFKKNERIWMSPDFKAIRFEIRDLKIILSELGNTAWFFCMPDDINEWKGKPASRLNTRWTGVLEKRDGKWVAVQVHFSFPGSK